MNFFMPVHILMYSNCIRQAAADLDRMGTCALMITDGASDTATALDQTIATSGRLKIVSRQDIHGELLNMEQINEICQEMMRTETDVVLAAGSSRAMSAGKLCRQAFAERTGRRLPLVLCPIPQEAGSGVTPYACSRDQSGQLLCQSSTQLYADLLLLDAQCAGEGASSLWMYALVEAMAYLLEAMVLSKGSLLGRGFIYDSLSDICFGLKSLDEDLVDSLAQEVMGRSILKAGIVAGQSGSSLLYALESRLSQRKGISSGKAAARLLSSYTEYLWSRDSHKVQSFFGQMGFRNVAEFTQEFCFLFPEDRILTETEAAEMAEEIMKERRSWGLEAPGTEEISRILSTV